MYISIILPVYNELGNLRPLFSEIESAMASMKVRYEVIAIDDASTDGSTRLLEKLCEEKTYLKVIFLRRNQGQTAALDAGFSYALGTVIVTLDSDRQNDPKDIPRLIAKLGDEYDLISGWRKHRQDDWLVRTLPSRLANKLIRAVTGTKVHDLGCSLKVYRREIVEGLRLYGEMHRFLPVLVEDIGGRVGELAVNHRPRVQGKSKYGLSRTFKVLLDLVTVWFMRNYRTKPIYLFGGAGFFLATLSGFIALWVIYEKIRWGIWVHKNPLFNLSSMFVILGAQFLALGILAEIMVRTYFESQGKRAYSIAKVKGFETEDRPHELPRGVSYGVS